MSSLVFLLIFLVIGLVAQKLLPEDKQMLLANFLNKFVIYISLPALVIISMVDLKVDTKFLLPAITAWGLFIFASILVLILAKIFNWSKSLTCAMLLLVTYGNSSFLGIPFTKAFYGDSAVAYAIIYDQLGSFLILSIFGVITLSLYSTKRANFKEIIFKIITFPSFVALVIALLLNPSVIPNWAYETLELIAKTLTPVALIAIGLFLKLKLPKHHIKPLTIALSLKLLILPLLVLLIFKALNLNDISAKVTLLEVSMAPMITASMLAIMANIQRDFVASTLGYGIALSFITAPLLLTLY